MVCCRLISIWFVGVVLAQDNGVFMPPSVIMTEPPLIIKDKNKELQMSCLASGSPPPSIQWYRNGNPVGESTSTINTLNQIMAPGKYQCTAKNTFGTAMSNITEVQEAKLGNFLDRPAQPVGVDEGEPLKLTCDYSGDPFSNPQALWSWVLQDKVEAKHPQTQKVNLDGRLSVDDRGNLYFQHVLGNDNPNNWFHLCSASNGIMNVQKNGSPSRLRIRPRSPIPDAPPELVYQNGKPSGTTGTIIEVIEGEDIEMYCIFKGHPKVEVRWEKLGSTPKPFMYRENGNTKIYIKTSQNTDQYEGRYRCTGYQKTGTGTATAEFTVNVLQKPTILMGPINTNVTEGDSVTFTCKAKAEPAAQIEWFVNGEPKKDWGIDKRREVIGDSFTVTKLRRGSTPQDSDLQVVTCMAINYRPNTMGNDIEIGRSYMAGYINIIKPLSFVTPPVNHTITDSSLNVILDCEISSDPSKATIVSWHRNDFPLVLNTDLYETAPNNSLIILTRNFDDLDDVKGEYMCVGETKAPPQRIFQSAWVDVKSGVVPIAVISAGTNLWWIGLILVLLILIIIIILICCLIKKNSGESYPVDEIERNMGNDPEKDLEDQGFHEYQRKHRNPVGGSRASLDSSIHPMDSDDDSMLEYGDIDPGKFNEDGSFIGQYAINDRKQADTKV